ncbi:MAG: serine/threonine-protein kinase [Myxococcota bacterium]|nr:serine/threonine-protein kinase [Myxococcota bacterium]
MDACLDDHELAAIVAGDPDPEHATWLVHLEACDRCRSVIAALVKVQRDSASAPTEPAGNARAPDAPRVIGRYQITGLLGAGGMGVVYEARDPELARTLAIKLLHESAAAAEHGLTARLVREARALAQLAHPNVVTVHDVGEHEGRAFLAMEYIRGTTLRDWLRDEPRSWRQVVRVFEQAARGLAAAHAAGLVHRDFKPDNVMIGTDERVRVTDFGLVRPLDASELLPTSSTGSSGLTLTASGTLLGTPAYMSPEQHLGLPGDARSDQFNFMVALFEALYGVRPFTGNTRGALAASVLEGRLANPLPGRRVPRWLRRLVERGLAREPDARHPSLAAIADALARGVARKPTLAIAATAGVAVVISAAILMRPEPDPCAGGAAQIAQAWSEGVKARVRAAFLNTGKPFADDAFTGVVGALDRYAGQWATAHRETCEASAVRHEQSPELLDLRMACLGRHRVQLAALVELLSAADADLVERAPRSVAQLPATADCADLERLRTVAVIAPAKRARLAELEATHARAQALSDAGRYREAVEVARPLMAAASELGYRPFEADTLATLAGVEQDLGHFVEAERLLRAAILAAESGGHDKRKAKSWAALIDLVGNQRGKPRDAIALEPEARAVVERVADERLRADFDMAVARVLSELGEYKRSRERSQSAIETLERLDGPDAMSVSTALDGLLALDLATGNYKEHLVVAERVHAIRRAKLGAAHPLTGKALQNLANAQFLVGDSQKALVTAKQALDLAVAAYGPKHPEVALVRHNYGAMLERTGRFDEASVEVEASLAIRRELLGPEHPDVATSLLNLGNIHLGRGELAKAEAALRTCLAIREKVLGAEHPDLEIVIGNLGSVLAAKHDLDGAQAMYERALAITERGRGKEHPGVSIHLTNIARLATERKRPADALPLYERAMAIDEKHLGLEHPQLGYHLQGLATAYADLGRPKDAIAAATRALEVFERAGVVTARVAETRMVLAEALVASRGDRARARAEAERALAFFQKEPTQYAEWVTYATGWLREHRR